MPTTYTVEVDGKRYDLEGDHEPSEAEARAAIASMPSSPSPTASLTVGALRTVPVMAGAVARGAANHPAAAQKIIGAGVSTIGGTLGAVLGGTPGGVVGASIRGVTPAQSTIRQVAGQLGGETPQVARNAGRAVGVINYAKETPGLIIGSKDLAATGNATRALDNYAESMGHRVVRVLGPDGKVVIGPEAAARAVDTGSGASRASRALGTTGRILGGLQMATGVTDLAQMAEPNRRDIGVMGIGSAPTAETMQMSPEAFQQYQQQHPPLLNDMASRFRQAVLSLMR